MKCIYILESKRIMVLVMNKDFFKVAVTKDIQPSRMKEVEVGGEKVCIVNVDGKFYAIDNVCTHEGGPLAEGTLEGYEVECPWHGSRFDVRTGEVINPPAETPQPLYEVKVEDSNILVRKKGAA
jgi:nitrite reductase/ring-hydroxylating ferredoxin subunit